ncbi:MAG: outer membrane protein assembly factor BamD [Gammaproteobacteria bacterium]|nr:outer membrane protein assembly factor BamD [Gammaproteobacteria bacterium]
MLKIILRLKLSIFLLLLPACTSLTELSKTSGEEQIYKAAQQALQAKNYRLAIEHYEALETRFPFGRYATEGQLEIIEAYLKMGELDSAVAASDRFIRLHADHKELDKAYYLKGVALFELNWSFIQKILPIDMTERDQKAAREAFNAFAELLKLFPASQYAQDAKNRMIYLRDGLAEHELSIAEYYFERAMYVAASERAQYIIEHFPNTSSVKGALELQVKAYRTLQLEDLAEAAERLLKENYKEEN